MNTEIDDNRMRVKFRFTDHKINEIKENYFIRILCIYNQLFYQIVFIILPSICTHGNNGKLGLFLAICFSIYIYYSIYQCHIFSSFLFQNLLRLGA